MRIQRVTEDVGKMRLDYERRIQDGDMKLVDSERRAQSMAQELGKLKSEYESKLMNIAQEARTLRTEYEAKIDLMQRQLDAVTANLNVRLGSFLTLKRCFTTFLFHHLGNYPPT